MRQRSSAAVAPPRTASPACPAAATSQSSKAAAVPSPRSRSPSPPGLATTQPRRVGRAPAVTSIPVAEWVSIRQPLSAGVACTPVTRTAGEEVSPPSTTRSRTVAAAVTVIATPDGGSIRTVPGPWAATIVTGLSSSRFSRKVPGRTVTVSPGSAAARASASVS